MNRLLWGFLAAVALALVGFVTAWRFASERDHALARVTELEKRLALPASASSATVLPPTVTEPSRPGAPTKPLPLPTTLPADAHVITDLRARLQDLEESLRKATSEREQAVAQTAEQLARMRTVESERKTLEESLTNSQRALTAAEAESKTNAERLASLEASQRSLQDRLAKAEAQARTVTRTNSELDDLNRRREASLASLQQRYREVTDLLRNFSLNAQTRETPAAGLHAGDLSRIQTTLQQAEDELRQLRALNARAASLARGR